MQATIKSGVAQSKSGTPQDQASNSAEVDTRKRDEQSTENMLSSALPAIQHTSPHKAYIGGLFYEKYYKEPVNRTLTPLFFVSLSPIICY